MFQATKWNIPGPSSLGAKWSRFFQGVNSTSLVKNWHPDWKVLPINGTYKSITCAQFFPPLKKMDHVEPRRKNRRGTCGTPKSSPKVGATWGTSKVGAIFVFAQKNGLGKMGKMRGKSAKYGGSWWLVNPNPFEKYAKVNLEHFPRVRGEH